MSTLTHEEKLKHDGGFDLNVNIRDVPAIDTPNCDLLPVMMNASY